MKLITKNLPTSICRFAIVFLLPAVCLAEDGLYLAGGAGISNLESIGIDDDDIAYRGIVGWGFNDYIAVEAGYSTIGSYENTPVPGLPELTVVEAKINGFTTSLALTIPITNAFTVLARAGGLFYDAEWRHVVDSGSGTLETLSTNFFDDNGTEFSFGAGVLYGFNEKVAVRGEWERFKAGEFDVDVISANLQVNFW